MIKKSLLLFFLPFAAMAAPEMSIPFYLGGWELVLGKQFETKLNEHSDQAKLDIHSFWNAYDHDKIKTEAIAFLKLSKTNASFLGAINPDEYKISITGIHMENLASLENMVGFSLDDGDGKHWYIVVQISAWGKEQLTGLPLFFQLVMIPGRGFKTPSLMKSTSEKLK